MDATLNEFIAQTGAQPLVAKRFLEGQRWDLRSALQAYTFLRSNNASCRKAYDFSSPSRFQIDAVVVDGDSAHSRPVLRKLDAIDLENEEGTAGPTEKKLSRGISKATENVTLVTKARTEVEQDFTDAPKPTHYFLETPVYTFTLPDLTGYPEDFRAFLEKDLIELSTLVSLEQAGKLNWWADSGGLQRLWPLATTGDGNCLLHAASLGMWGFHDRLLTLRKALHAYMTSSNHRDALWRRWRWQQAQLNKQSSLVLTEEEWKIEWDGILSLSSSEPRTNQQRPSKRNSCCESLALGDTNVYQSLEEVHVLALAHILRRPIVIVSDTLLRDVQGEPLAPIPFGGVYLPLECSPSECHRSPLVLTYDAAHFSALVVMETDQVAGGDSPPSPVPPAGIPLTDSEHDLLPIHFLGDPGEEAVWNKDEDDPVLESKLTLTNSDKLGLLNEYLDVVQVPMPPVDEEQWDEKYKTMAPKQLHSVAKQFGSIGKSMGKKLKKNLSYLTGMGKAGMNGHGGKHHRAVRQNSRVSHSEVEVTETKKPDYILCALLHIDKRHEYHDEMIKNYLESAKDRFNREMKRVQAVERARISNSGSHCMSPECSDCYSPLRYGTGNSVFYAEADSCSRAEVRRLPSCLPPTSKDDATLYLSNSTFYSDQNNRLRNLNLRDYSVPNSIVEVPVIQVKNIRNCEIVPSELSTVSINERTGSVIAGNGRELSVKPCRNLPCEFYGSPETHYFCSKCWKEHLLVTQLRNTQL